MAKYAQTLSDDVKDILLENPRLMWATIKAGLAVSSDPLSVDLFSLEREEELMGVRVEVSLAKPKQLLNTLLNPISYVKFWDKKTMIGQVVNSALDFEDWDRFYQRNEVYGPLLANEAYGGVLKKGPVVEKRYTPEYEDENGVPRFTKYGIHEQEVRSFLSKANNVYLPQVHDIDGSLLDLRGQGLDIAADEYVKGVFYPDEAERYQVAQDLYYREVQENYDSAKNNFEQVAREYQQVFEEYKQAQAKVDSFALKKQANKPYDESTRQQALADLEEVKKREEPLRVRYQQRQREYVQAQDEYEIFEQEPGDSSSLRNASKEVEKAERRYDRDSEAYRKWDRGAVSYKEAEVFKDVDRGEITREDAEKFIKRQEKDPIKLQKKLKELDRYGYVVMDEYKEAEEKAERAHAHLHQARISELREREQLYRQVFDDNADLRIRQRANQLNGREVRIYHAAYQQEEKHVLQEARAARQRARRELAETEYRLAQLRRQAARQERIEAEGFLRQQQARGVRGRGRPAGVVNARGMISQANRREKEALELLNKKRESFAAVLQESEAFSGRGVDLSQFSEQELTKTFDINERLEQLSRARARAEKIKREAEEKTARFKSHRLNKDEYQRVQQRAGVLTERYEAQIEARLKARVGSSWQEYFNQSGTRLYREKAAASRDYALLQAAAHYGALDEAKKDFAGIQRELLAAETGGVRREKELENEVLAASRELGQLTGDLKEKKAKQLADKKADLEKLKYLNSLSDEELLRLDLADSFINRVKYEDPNKADALIKRMERLKKKTGRDLASGNLPEGAAWVAANVHTGRILDLKYNTRDFLQNFDKFLETGDVSSIARAFIKQQWQLRVRMLKIEFNQNNPLWLRKLAGFMAAKNFDEGGVVTLKGLLEGRTKVVRNWVSQKVLSLRWGLALLTGTEMKGEHWERELAKRLLEKGGLWAKMVVPGTMNVWNLKEYLEWWSGLGGRLQKKLFGTFYNKVISNAAIKAFKKAVGELAKKAVKKLTALLARWGLEAVSSAGLAAVPDMVATVAWEAARYLGSKTLGAAKKLLLTGEVQGPVGYLLAAAGGLVLLPIIGVLFMVITSSAALEDFSGYSGGGPISAGYIPGETDELGHMCPYPVSAGVCEANCDPDTNRWPLDPGFVMTSCFGCRHLAGDSQSRFHAGVDLSTSSGTGTHIYASTGGTLSYQEWSPAGVSGTCPIQHSNYGNMICITTETGAIHLYAHLSGFAGVTSGWVDEGALIGYMGNTGHSFGAHLHFEVRRNGEYVNPCDGLSGSGCSGCGSIWTY